MNIKYNATNFLTVTLLTILMLASNDLFAKVVTYSYDSLNRLTNVSYGNGATSTFTYDAAGNRLAYSGVVTNDAVSPAVAISIPTSSPNFTTTNPIINLSGTATDNFGLGLITWENFGVGFGAASGTTTWNASSIHLQPGANYFYVTAYDLAGNSTEVSLTVTYTLPVGPALQGSISSGSMKLSWDSSSASGYILQYADSLTPPILWSNVVATWTTNAGNVNVTLPTTNAQRFFRLKN